MLVKSCNIVVFRSQRCSEMHFHMIRSNLRRLDLLFEPPPLLCFFSFLPLPTLPLPSQPPTHKERFKLNAGTKMTENLLRKLGSAGVGGAVRKSEKQLAAQLRELGEAGGKDGPGCVLEGPLADL